MTETLSPYAKAVKQLHKAGYSTIPLAPRDKRAYLDDWSKFCVKRMGTKAIKKFMEEDGLNIGVALGPASGVVALDFDADVDGLHDRIKDLIPESPVIKFGERGFTAFYRYNGEKNRSWKVKRDGKKITVLELLSEGRQTVMPPSVHPSGAVYEYLSMEELSDIDPSNLPELPSRLSRELDAMFGVELEDKPEINWTIEELKEPLEFISSDDYEDWITVGMALKSAYPDEDGFALWDEWSQSSDKYDPQESEAKWASFKGQGVGLGSLFYLAMQNGYQCQKMLGRMKEDTLRSFITLDQVEDEVDSWRFVGRDKGSSCGVAGMDAFLHFRKGEVTVLSGYGNAGKSEFLDSVVTGLMQGTEDWRFAICSMEKLAHKHFDDLIHKYARKPREDLSVEEYRKAKSFLRDRVIMVDYNSVQRDFDKILLQFRKYMKFGQLDGILIDPFNYLITEHKHYNQLAHTNHVITKCTDFAKEMNTHVFIVAHPTKPDTTFGKLPKMTKYSIAGGADWVNVADNIIIVTRNKDDTTSILVDKVRDQEFDRLGEFTLQYDKYTRGYTRVEDELDDEF